MAWLSERFNSLTGKISDFTKEVILNDTSNDGVQEYSYSQLCQDQDLVIKELLNQKKEMENNIVELDKQHQEAINELLSLKQHLAQENKQLKDQLSAEKQKSTMQDLNFNLSTSLMHYLNGLLPNEIENINLVLKDFIIFTVLEPLRNCSEHSIINKQIARLEKLKCILEEKSKEIDPDFSSIVLLIDSYISYLNLICTHREKLIPVMEETASFMCQFVENKYQGNKDCNYDIAQNQVLLSSEKLPATVPSGFVSERNIPAKLPLNVVSQYCQTDSKLYSCSSELQKSTNSDSYCQTDNEFMSSDCCRTASSSRLSIESADLKQKVSIDVDAVNQRGFKMLSVALQTDSVCECEALKSELDKTVASMNILKKEIAEKEENLQSQLQHQTASTQNWEEKFWANQKLIADKDEVIANQSKDISALRCEMKTLCKQLNQISECTTVNSDNSRIISHRSTEQNNFNEAGQLLMSVSDNDKLLLQQKLKAVDLEKSKLLYVLNEKSQECSNLKAEVHRLMSIVVSEKQALSKLQRDNQDLKQVQESNLDIDLTKEALQNLSHLVRDKDLEIEALKQKNSSLTAVVQQSTSGAEQIQSLIEEREGFLKSIAKFKAEREKIMASYNSKDQACRQQQAEIKNLKSELEQLSEKLELLQQQHQTVLQQYEEKQKFSIKVQDEMIIMKQHVADLEQAEVDIKIKYNELLNQMNSDLMVTVSREELTSKTMEIENLRTNLKERDDLIHEKDCLIHELSQQVKSLKLSLEQANNEIADLKKANSEQVTKLNDCELAIKKMWDEKESLNQRLSDKQSEVNLLKEVNERLSMTVKEKEFSVQSLEEKISSLSSIICGNNASPTSPADIDQILAESREMYSKAQNFHRERDETLLALSQSQQEKELLKNEIQRLMNNEDHLKNELNRLRKHLLQIEENYTNEALKAETREKELRNQLAEVERSAKVSNSAVLDASHQASVQVASLQEQITMIASQRDRALAQLSGLEDKVQEYAASLNNLQLVLEQMQKGHEQKIESLEKKWQAELNEAKQQCIDLQKVIDVKQKQLEESSQALEAASRLSEQIDTKEVVIAHLKTELVKTEKKLKLVSQEIDSVKNNSEGKVDRVVMKSLVLGYFSTPPGQKSEVVRLLARVLDFNQQEMAKAGIVVGKNTGTVVHRGLLSSFFGRLPLLSSTQEQSTSQSSHKQNSTDQHQSFATLFVKFLENESQPIVPMPLPAEEMARELTSKAKANKHSPKNQLLSPSSDKGSLLIGINSTFPTFAPVPPLEYSSPTVLQEILQ